MIAIIASVLRIGIWQLKLCRMQTEIDCIQHTSKVQLNYSSFFRLCTHPQLYVLDHCYSLSNLPKS